MNFKAAVCGYLTAAVIASCVCSAYPASKSEPKEQVSQPSSGGMSYERQWMMYQSEKKSPIVPFLVNAILYPGLGNYLMDSYLTGTVLLVTYFYSAGLMMNGETDEEILMGANGVLLAWVAGMITAFTDTSSYNRKLQKRLGLRASLKPIPDAVGVMLAFDRRF